jgi:glycosyltransferase involved in cell wall biosynthesis
MRRKSRVRILAPRTAEPAQQSRTPFHLVSCSYLVPVKRLHLIAEALKQADFPVVWTHIGSGPLEKELRAKAEELPPNVTAEFLGQRDNREILDYYKNNPVSVFVNVSFSEGIPVTIMEAYSFGIPAIATDVGGTHEIVSDGGNGFLLRADFSPHELLDRLQQLRSMGDAEYNVLCVNARRTWREKFNAPGNYKRFYEEIST